MHTDFTIMKHYFFKIFFLFILTFLVANTSKAINPPYLKDTSNVWVDSILKNMTLDEKIGQLFMVAAYSNKEEATLSIYR